MENERRDDAEFEAAYDRWRDDCATELCEAVDMLVAEVARDAKSYFKDRQDEAFRVIFVHSRARIAEKE